MLLRFRCNRLATTACVDPEESLACEFQPIVAQAAFTAAHRAGDSARARKYFPHVRAEERELSRDACMVFHGVDLGD